MRRLSSLLRPGALLLAFCAFSCLPARAEAPRIVLPEDVPPALRELLQRHLSRQARQAPQNEAERRMMAADLTKVGRELLATEGYFDARLELSGDDLEALVLRVEPGAASRVTAVDIVIDGPLPADRRQALRENWSLGTGDIFRQEAWTRAKENLLISLLERDFPAAHLVASKAEIEGGEARLSVHYASGPPYRFGELRITGLSRYTPELVARYNREVRPGEPYDAMRLARLQSVLENTPYFTFVSAELLREEEAAIPGDEQGTRVAPIRLALRERAAHQLGVGVGASSNTGARMEVNFRTADFFATAWQLKSGLRVEELRQSFYADLFFPPSPKDYHYAAGFLAERSNIRDLELQTRIIGVSRTRRKGNVETSLNTSFITEREKPHAGESRRNQALTLNASWTWKPRLEVDEHLSQFQAGGSIKPVSDRDFVRLYALVQHRWKLDARNAFALRGEGGIVLADSREGIPQNFLFRAGGAASVRGYPYQSLGVQEGRSTLGGRYLLTLSGEYTHWLADSPWGVAAFIDAGNAADDKKAFRLQRGYGVGARWRNQSATLGMDLAYGEATGNWHLHFAFELPLY
ncbi:MAG: BamA/TamA family outer membrane protein [Zoogloeaceae bacterium]|jgi:translocation and assembly module TamA|nr:BamA/TamA family outer membrane protein [Zoogloeaceae bacterium]